MYRKFFWKKEADQRSGARSKSFVRFVRGVGLWPLSFLAQLDREVRQEVIVKKEMWKEEQC